MAPPSNRLALFKAADLDDLFDRSLVLSLQPPMKGDNMLIITNGGGVGVLATDSAEKYGVPLKFAPADVQEALKKAHARVWLGQEPGRPDRHGWQRVVSRLRQILVSPTPGSTAWPFCIAKQP